MASPGLGEEDKVLDALTKSYPLPVLYARKALVEFRARDSPLPRFTFSFKQDEFLHFKQPYGNSGWWIGRVVGEKTWLGLIPGEERLRAYHERLAEEQDREVFSGPVYEDAPIMRPIVFMGPSRKDAELTELLQKALVTYLKEQFAGRLHTIKPQHLVGSNMSDSDVRSLRGEVYGAGHSFNLVFLDCDASFPEDVLWLQIHPLLIYVQVARRKVLQKLVRELTSSRDEREDQLQAAYLLYETSTFTPSPYSLVISDSDLDDACQNLELFVESYWAATRSVRLTPIQPHSPHPPTVSPHSS